MALGMAAAALAADPAAVNAPQFATAADETEVVSQTIPGPTIHPNGYCGSASVEVLMAGAYGSAEFGVTTTHGVMLRDRFFIGLGAGYIRDFSYDQSLIPIYGEARLHFAHREEGRIMPHVGLRLGGALASEGSSGFYGTLSAGVRVPLSGKCGLSLEIGPSIITKYLREGGKTNLAFAKPFAPDGYKVSLFLRLSVDF